MRKNDIDEKKRNGKKNWTNKPKRKTVAEWRQKKRRYICDILQSLWIVYWRHLTLLFSHCIYRYINIYCVKLLMLCQLVYNGCNGCYCFFLFMFRILFLSQFIFVRPVVSMSLKVVWCLEHKSNVHTIKTKQVQSQVMWCGYIEFS